MHLLFYLAVAIIDIEFPLPKHLPFSIFTRSGGPVCLIGDGGAGPFSSAFAQNAPFCLSKATRSVKTKISEQKTHGEGGE